MLPPVRSRIAEKREMRMPDRETRRLVRRIVPPAQRAVPCLAPDELTAVARLAKAADRHYRTPQDVEWAIDADLPAPDNVVLLQSRSETVWRHKSRPAPAGDVHGCGVSRLAATLIAPLAGKPPALPTRQKAKNVTEKTHAPKNPIPHPLSHPAPPRDGRLGKTSSEFTY